MPLQPDLDGIGDTMSEKEKGQGEEKRTSALSSGLKSPTLTLCFLGATRTCPAVRGRMSRNAMTCSLEKSTKDAGSTFSGSSSATEVEDDETAECGEMGW